MKTLIDKWVYLVEFEDPEIVTHSDENVYSITEFEGLDRSTIGKFVETTADGGLALMQIRFPDAPEKTMFRLLSLHKLAVDDEVSARIFATEDELDGYLFDNGLTHCIPIARGGTGRPKESLEPRIVGEPGSRTKN